MKYLIGIDEVGRGPIAGPVAVGVFLLCEPKDMPAEARKNLRKLFPGVKESKQLSEKSREAWFARVESARGGGAVDFAVAFESEKSIDKNGFKGKPGILSEPLGDDNINMRLSPVLENLANELSELLLSLAD